MIATKLQLSNAPSTQEEEIMVDSCKSMICGCWTETGLCKNNEVLQKLPNNVKIFFTDTKLHGLIFINVDCLEHV